MGTSYYGTITHLFPKGGGICTTDDGTTAIFDRMGVEWSRTLVPIHIGGRVRIGRIIHPSTQDHRWAKAEGISNIGLHASTIEWCIQQYRRMRHRRNTP